MQTTNKKMLLTKSQHEDRQVLIQELFWGENVIVME